VEVWQTSNLRRLILGEEKKNKEKERKKGRKKERKKDKKTKNKERKKERKKERTNYRAKISRPALFHRAAINRLRIA